jgi:hypothetical protein
MDAASEWARSEGRHAIVVATAAADIANLRFCLRRMRGGERDAFTAETGYPPGLRDRVWLDRSVTP